MLSENSQPKVELEMMDDNTDKALTPPPPVANTPVAQAPTKRRLNPLLIIVPLVLLVLLLLFAAGAYLLLRDGEDEDDYSDINSYEECAAAGYPIMESFPEQCATPDGRTFTRQLTEEEQEEQEDEENGGSEEEGETGQKTVKVYFSVTPESNDDPTYVVAVNRTTTRSDVGAFSIEQLITGPNAAEVSDGYFTPLKVSGTSNCSGKDFSLNIESTTKIATLKFCKNVTIGGILDEARVSQTVESTLKQFSTIESVVILTKDDNCFGDESGMNLCKES